MIAPLRRRHRWMTFVLGVLTVALFLLALASRAPEPRVPELPAIFEAEGAP